MSRDPKALQPAPPGEHTASEDQAQYPHNAASDSAPGAIAATTPKRAPPVPPVQKACKRSHQPLAKTPPGDPEPLSDSSVSAAESPVRPTAMRLRNQVRSHPAIPSPIPQRQTTDREYKPEHRRSSTPSPPKPATNPKPRKPSSQSSRHLPQAEFAFDQTYRFHLSSPARWLHTTSVACPTSPEYAPPCAPYTPAHLKHQHGNKTHEPTQDKNQPAKVARSIAHHPSRPNQPQNHSPLSNGAKAHHRHRPFSRTARTLPNKASDVNGFSINSTDSSNTPCSEMMSDE